MIKHGSKFINAVSNSGVPHITILMGASYGAGTRPPSRPPQAGLANTHPRTRTRTRTRAHTRARRQLRNVWPSVQTAIPLLVAQLQVFGHGPRPAHRGALARFRYFSLSLSCVSLTRTANNKQRTTNNEQRDGYGR